MAHARLGEALLALLRLGNLDSDERRVERWVAETRERFPDAEWAYQIYADALELWERWPEALIAWCDATASIRTTTATSWARCARRARSGGLSGGRHQLRRALALPPGRRPGLGLAGRGGAGGGAPGRRRTGGRPGGGAGARRGAGRAPPGHHRRAARRRPTRRPALLEAVAERARVGTGHPHLAPLPVRRPLGRPPGDTASGSSRRIPGSTGAWSVYMDALMALGDGEARGRGDLRIAPAGVRSRRSTT